MWLQIDGSAWNSDLIACVRPVGDGSKQCSIFMPGSSPVDGGFLVNQSFDEVFHLIQSARIIEIADMMRGQSGDEDERGHISPSI